MKSIMCAIAMAMAISTEAAAERHSASAEVIAESTLSGVGRTPGKDNELLYRTGFRVPAGWKGKRVLLHFGAVDWKTTCGLLTGTGAM